MSIASPSPSRAARRRSPRLSRRCWCGCWRRMLTSRARGRSWSAAARCPTRRWRRRAGGARGGGAAGGRRAADRGVAPPLRRDAGRLQGPEADRDRLGASPHPVGEADAQGAAVIDRDAVAGWLDRYIEAWTSYDRERIGELFAEDAAYRYHPFDEPIRGREAIVDSW